MNQKASMKERKKRALAAGQKRLALAKKTRFEMTKRHHSKTYLEAKKMGRMDEDFVKLCDLVEKSKDFFTSSSCAGRISLISLGEEETKKESAFYRKWHRKVVDSEVLEAVKSFEGKVLWFKQEPIILHLGTNSLENARKILQFCEVCGIKRAGIKTAKDGKYIVEMVGTQNIDVPIKEGKNYAGEDYLKYLVKKANQKFEKNQELIIKMEAEAKKFFN